jgi:hypothetical protein
MTEETMVDDVTNEQTPIEVDGEETSEVVSDAAQEEEQDETSTEDSETSEESKTEEKAKKKTGRGVERRFKRMTREKYELRAERDYYKRLAEERQDNTGDKSSQETNATNEPSLDDFDSFEDYNRALIKWEVKQGTQKETTSSTEARNDRPISNDPELEESWMDAVEEFMDEHDDFEEVLNSAPSDIIFNPKLELEIFKMGVVGAEILYKLAKDPVEAERIGKLSENRPYAAIKEIKKIEAELQAEKAKQTTRTKTKAPAPITTSKGSAKVDKDPGEMSLDEYEAWRNKNRR